MKRWLVVLLSLLSFSSVIMAQTTTSQPGSNTGTTYTLNIQSSPSNAVVYVDGNRVSGNSIRVTPGVHTVSAQAAGYNDYSTSVNVQQNMNITINMNSTSSGSTLYTLSFRVSPSNAIVYVDGNRVSGNSLSVTRGTHSITAQANGYTNFSASVNVLQNMTYSIDMKAASTVLNQYTLSFQVSPSNAMVYVDGNRVSGTSIRLNQGQHVVTAKAQGYSDYSVTINLQQNMTFPISMAPLSYRLTVTTNVSNASIYVDGTKILGNAATVNTGIHTIRVEANGYQSYSAQVEVNGNITVPVNLTALQHSLSVDVSNIRGAQVQIDGNLVGITPYVTSLSPGIYTITVTASGYETYSERVAVNGPTVLKIALQQERFATVSFILPKGIVVGQGSSTSKDRVDIYVDGIQQSSSSFQVRSGTHTIRILSGNFAIDQTIDVQAGRNYLIQPMLQVIVQ